eukprot:259048-Hanusia_phi.AAC.1
MRIAIIVPVTGNRTALILEFPPWTACPCPRSLDTQCSGRNPCVSLQMQRPPDVCVCTVSIQMDLTRINTVVYL